MLTAAIAELNFTPFTATKVEEILSVLRNDYPYASTFTGAGHCESQSIIVVFVIFLFVIVIIVVAAVAFADFKICPFDGLIGCRG